MNNNNNETLDKIEKKLAEIDKTSKRIKLYVRDFHIVLIITVVLAMIGFIPYITFNKQCGILHP